MSVARLWPNGVPVGCGLARGDARRRRAGHVSRSLSGTSSAADVSGPAPRRNPAPDELLEMTPQDGSRPGISHDVLRVGHHLRHLEAILAQIPVAAEVHVLEPHHVAEL